MGKFSPTKLTGDCEEIANPSTAYLRLIESSRNSCDLWRRCVRGLLHRRRNLTTLQCAPDPFSAMSSLSLYRKTWYNQAIGAAGWHSALG